MRALALIIAVITLVLTVGAAHRMTTAEDRRLTWIWPDELAVGGGELTAAEVSRLQDLGFRGIADLAPTSPDARREIQTRGMDYLELPAPSAMEINETMLLTFRAWAKAQLENGRPVYVHCPAEHSGSTIALAWKMIRDDQRYDDALDDTRARWPRMDAPALSALLELDAGLRGTPPLAVTLNADRYHPGAGGRIPAYVDVLAGGYLIAGARVQVWSDASGLRVDGLTDPDGRLAFTYAAPASGGVDHLYARASLDGFADGADNVEIDLGRPGDARPAPGVWAERVPEGVVVRVTGGATPDSPAVPARIVAASPGWTSIEASSSGRALFTDAPRGALSFRVASWGAPPGFVSLDALAGPELPPAPAPGADPRAAPAPPRPDALDHETVSHATAATVAITVLLSAYFAISSIRRAGAGRR